MLWCCDGTSTHHITRANAHAGLTSPVSTSGSGNTLYGDPLNHDGVRAGGIASSSCAANACTANIGVLAHTGYFRTYPPLRAYRGLSTSCVIKKLRTEALKKATAQYAKTSMSTVVV